MTRKKVELTYITNEAKRKSTLRKRKNGLMKKVDELRTLCGIEACAIVYSPNDPQPEVWPSQREVHKVLTRFRNMSELEQSKKMVNQESFLKQRILKGKEQLTKQRNENKKKEMTLHMFQCLNAGKILGNMNLTDLNDLSWLIDQNLKEISRRMTRIGQDQEATLTVGDGAAVNGEMEHVDRGKGLETNVDTMQKQSVDLINGGGDETLPFGDVNLENGFWPKPFVP